MTPIRSLHKPNSHPLKLAIFGSGQGTIIDALFKSERHYEITALFTDRRCPLLDLGQKYRVPVIYHSFKLWKGDRPSYERQIIKSLSPFKVDLVFLAGYMRLVGTPILSHFPNRVINIHPGDLTRVDRDGKRRFVGMHAIRDALNSGESFTRSTLFVVDKEMDAGPIISLGPKVPYTEGSPITEEKIRRHRQRHKQLSDWPASIQTLNLIAEGRVGLTTQGKITIDNQEEIYLCAESSPLLMKNL